MENSIVHMMLVISGKSLHIGTELCTGFAQGLHRLCTEVRNEKLFVSADDHQVHPLLITLVHFTMKPTMYCRDFFHPMVR